MRFLTYNLWHGLSPAETPVLFNEIEPVSRRELRYKHQLELLRDLKFDVAFLQEANPVQSRAAEFKSKLDVQVQFQPDLVGLKLFGLGIPLNLNSGLVTLVNSQFPLKRVEAISLDRPGQSLVKSWGSWQLSEERFALLTQTLLPGWGRVLLVNVHLHHGLESTPEFVSRIEAAAKDLELSDSVLSELLIRVEAGNRKREKEIRVLLAEIQKIESRFESVVLAGDFNCRPDGLISGLLQEAGFSDLWGGKTPGMTFDREVNRANHRLQEDFPLSVDVQDLSFSAQKRETLLRLFRNQEWSPRRIDQVWLKTHSLKINVKSAQLVGLPDVQDLAPSDHFGVCLDLEVQ